MSWDSEMAGLFKERNNKIFSGFVIGVVKLVKPLIISIENGQVMLDEDDLYSLQSLGGMSFESMTLDVSVLHSSVSAPQMKSVFKAEVVMKPLEIGDLVALLPNKTEQKYLIMNRVKKGGF